MAMRLIMLAAAVALAAGCGSKDKTDEDASEDGPPPDMALDTVGDVDEECVPTGEEVCDGEDNDCNGEIDEGFDLSVDPENCGACGFACEAPHGTASCEDSTCVITECDEGWINLNGSILDGCEYECTVTVPEESEADGTCSDGLDNDCDGRVDAEDPDCEECVPEFCDEMDNDCDGLVDEDFDLRTDVLNCGECGNACPPRAHSSPACILGDCRIICDAGYVNEDGDDTNGCEGACVPDTALDETTCDGIDSDCDGPVDEDYTPYTCGEGVCEADSVCWAGVEDCVPREPLLLDDRTCDDVDDDCDGEADDDYEPSDLCIGACRDTAVCVEGIEVCGTAASADTLCDLVDEDCDGEVDEDYEPYTCGSGACIRESTCIAGVEDCDDSATGSPEVCNGSDDDCDGTPDNGDPAVLCAPLPTDFHATPICNAGVCEIDTCDDGWLDLDALYSTGCECQQQIGGGEGASESCPTAHDLGSLTDTSTGSTTVTGKIAPTGDVDWYQFRAIDGAPIASFRSCCSPASSGYGVYMQTWNCDNFHVQVTFTSNPGNQFRAAIYKSVCTDGSPCRYVDQTGASNGFEWKTKCRSTSGSTVSGECPCMDCTDDDSSVFLIKVERVSGAATCDEYTLQISNGLAFSTSPCRRCDYHWLQVYGWCPL
jgi:hypothetical protein